MCSNKLFKFVVLIIIITSFVVFSGCGGITTPETPSDSLNAIITPTPTSGEAPLEVAFDASESSAAQGNEIVSYEWDFGDSKTGEGGTIYHGFDSPGNYTVILTISDNKGSVDTSSVVITVFQPTETVIEREFDSQSGTEFDTGTGLKIIIPPALIEGQMNLEVKYNSNPSQSASDLIKLHSNYSITITPQKGLQEKELMTSGMTKYQETTQISLIFDVPEDVDPQSLAIFEWTDEGWCLAGAGDIDTIRQLGGVLSPDGRYLSIEVPVENSLSTPAVANIFGIGDFIHSVVEFYFGEGAVVCPIMSEVFADNGNPIVIEKKVYFQSYSLEVFGSGIGIPYKVGILNNSNNLIINDDYPDWDQTYSGPYQILGSSEWYLMPSDDENEKGVLTLRFGSEGGECTVWLEADGVMLFEMWLLSIIPGVKISATLADIFVMYIENAGNYLMGDSVDAGKLTNETIKMLEKLGVEMAKQGIDLHIYGQALSLGWDLGDLIKIVMTYLKTTRSSQNPCYGYKSPGYWEWEIKAKPVNQLPVVSVTSPTDGSTYIEGETIIFEGKATDPEDGALTGDSLFWSLPSGKVIGTGESFSKNDLSVGTYVITLNAVDSQSRKGEYSVTITVTAAEKPDLRVVAVSLSNSSAQVGDTISVTFTVENKGGPVLGEFQNKVFLSTTQYGGEGQKIPLEDFPMSLGDVSSKTETVKIIVPQVPAGGWYIAVWTDATEEVQEANENNNIDSAPISISTNYPPIITSTPVTSATVGQAYIYDVNATDADGDTRTYSLAATKPSGMIINSSTGLITWTPATIGDYNVTVEVSDGIITVTQSFTITVTSITPEAYTITASAGPNGSISPSGNVTVNQGSDKSFTITPDTGYQIDDVLVDGNSVGAVSSHTFSNVNENHTISATFMSSENIILNSITVSPSTMSLVEGGSQTISSITAHYSDGSTADIALDDCAISSENPGVALVDTEGVIRAVSIGIATIRIIYVEDFIDKTDSVEVTVTSVAPETYTITASAGSHGSISPSGNVTVNQGSDKSFTITPDTGYQIDDVLVDGSSVGAVSSYTFTNVTQDHTISATFKSSDIISASINSYSPSSKITINTGQSFTINTSFTNTGNTAAYFYPGVSIWNSNGSLVFTDWGGKTYLNKDQQGSASWNHTINTPGEYWLQFGIWNEAKSELLDKKPSPSQNLIKVTTPSVALSFTGLTPSQIATSTAPYQATLSASGSNFNNVNRVSFSWSGAASGSKIWYKGDSNWNAAVTINSDNSMTLQPTVVETNPTWSGTVYWTVTLRDNTDATASKSFTVTYTPTTISASIISYSPSSKITVDIGQSFTISTNFTNTGNTAAYFYAGASVWDSSGNVIFNDWGGKTYLNIGQQGNASWSHTINAPGEYWLQFGVWNEAKSELFDKEPSPSQNLIKVVEPPTTLSFTNLTPSQISTSTSPYQATLSATGSNFNNVNRISFSWYGAASDSATWYKGDTNWNNKVTINSDNSMTLKPGVVETNPAWSGTAYWTVTLRDDTGKTASKSFTVTYTQLTPQVTGVDPSQPTANPSRQYITILGNNFVSGAQVTLQIISSVYPIPEDRTQFIDSTRIKLYVGLTDSGNWKVWITNPNGQKSNEYSFYVKP